MEVTHMSRETGVDNKDMLIKANLYWDQKADVEIGEKGSDRVKIKRESEKDASLCLT